MKAGKLQRTMSWLCFLRSHVILTLHINTKDGVRSDITLEARVIFCLYFAKLLCDRG